MAFLSGKRLIYWCFLLLLPFLIVQQLKAQTDLFLPLVTNGTEFEESEEEILESNGTIPPASPDSTMNLKASERLQATCSAGYVRVLRPRTSDGRTDSTKAVLYCQKPKTVQAAGVDAQTVTMTLNQTLYVNCNGDRLRALRPKTASGKTDNSRVILECRGTATVVPTATPPSGSTLTPTATPPPGSTPTPTRTPTVTPTQGPPTATPPPVQATVNDRLVFVIRQRPAGGTIYWDVPKAMAGVGPYSRFQIAAPGKLVIREANGQLRTLIDGAAPTAASLNLVDVNAPEVSYDGTRIVFAGLPQKAFKSWDYLPMALPSAWRLFVINVDGTGLRQLTFSDQDNLSMAQFPPVGHELNLYDDTDPAWLPDGRIVFASTRWPSYAMYSAARTSNLYVVNADGSNLHRITAERNGAERPQVDPITGKIIFSRWWRNFHTATNDMSTIPDPAGGYIQYNGLLAADRAVDANSVGGGSNLKRNAWQLATINPDGTELAQFAGRSGTFLLNEDANAAYGGAFTPDGTFYANYFPMKNMSEASGFGGIRRYVRGANGYTPILGVTTEVGYQLVTYNPPSYGVFQSEYASEPVVLPDGRLVVSWAADVQQDYGLYVISPDGRDRQLLYDLPGTAELRARVVAPRSVPPIIPDKVTHVASLLPPLATPPYNIDGSFTFEALNVYFNAPVDVDIVSAIPVGSASTIRFFINHQRDQIGSPQNVNWPILLEELPINPDGSVVTTQAPADVPLFEQIRTRQADGYTVPLTGRGEPRNGGAAHVAGLNYGRPGTTARCVGCHAGHTLIPVPADPAEAKFTNLAPGAVVSFSSTNPHPSLDQTGLGLVDRHVRKGKIVDYWRSDPAQDPNQQWVQLTFPVPVTVRTVRLYNPRPGDATGDSDLQVQQATVRLYSDAAATTEVASGTASALSVNGTDVAFNQVMARSVRVYFNNVTGTLEGQRVASLAEIEVIARGEAGQ